MSWPCTFLGGEDKRDVVANLAELGLPFVTSQRESKETFRKERPVKEANDGLFPLSCVDETALLQERHLRTFAIRPSLPWTGVCCRRCRVWKQLWRCRGWVPATANRDAMLNIQAFAPSPRGGAGRETSPTSSRPTFRTSARRVALTFYYTDKYCLCSGDAPPLTLYTQACSKHLHTHTPSLTSLSAYDPRLQASCLFSSSLLFFLFFLSPQCRGFTPLHPGLSTDFISFFPLIFFFFCRSIHWRRALRPGTKFCYALTHIDSQSECITELWPEFPTSTAAWVHTISRAWTVHEWTDQ